MDIDINELLTIAREAGEAILRIYNDPAKSDAVTYKSDQSPLTLADEASNEVITKRLKDFTPDIPVLSEEGRNIPFEERKHWDYFWCVDPLDGTKEFVKRNGEFTVNIALIHKNRPILGVIFVPVTDLMYYASEADGAWKIDANGVKTALEVDRRVSGWTAVGSRTHSAPEEAEMLARYPVVKSVSVGSSLKFCLVAEGIAQIYYRLGPTMEWDTAAGQAILTYSGGSVTTPTGEPFLYNKESLLNGSFLCLVNQSAFLNETK
ncbi:3'(2'),5'-bisphosphate nucleotidase CysQ [Dyadobacter endophyticus]|uniref:3'(2'),5'-bisphosphate nucleotidase CysQ n=1 Tax=Dyadobacter endophyticus TaxID=1749036 RepID=A0ABQ1Z364_9BACT|nr:3'(2'),5'-bisphosphate nucleotidase CysQ [Dyadobacter endophyticus]GGH48561.1 3'(2'),5'-bisphosphate nucleotidase CysQ [Dyadobacter endophyticus]